METAQYQTTQTQVRVNTFVRSVYNWMAIGLGLTGLVAYYVANRDLCTTRLIRPVGLVEDSHFG